MVSLRVAIDASGAKEGALQVSSAFDTMRTKAGESASAIRRAESEVERAVTGTASAVKKAEEDVAEVVVKTRRRRASASKDQVDVDRKSTTDLLSLGDTIKAMEEDVSKAVLAQNRRREQAATGAVAARKQQIAALKDLTSRGEADVADAFSRAITGRAKSSISDLITEADKDVNRLIARARQAQTIPAAKSPASGQGARPSGPAPEDLRRQAAAAEIAARQVAAIGDAAISRLGPAAGVVRALTDQVGGLDRQLELAANQSKLTADQIAAIGIGAAALVAVGGALAFGVTKGVELERSFDAVRGRVDSTVASYEDLRAATRELADKSGIDRLEVNAALNEVLSEGYSKQADVLAVLSAAVDLARTKQIGLADAAKVLDANLDAYSRRASEAAKTGAQLFIGARNGEEDLNRYSTALAEVGKVATALHIPLEQVGALLSKTSATVGASESASGLSRLLLTLQNEADPANEKLQALGKAVGVDLSAAALRARGLTLFLEDVQTAIRGASDDAQALSQIFGNPRFAKTAFAALADGARGAQTDMSDATAATEKLKTAIDEVNSSATKEIGRRFSEGFNAIADLGADIAESLGKAALAISDFSSETDSVEAPKITPQLDLDAFVKQQLALKELLREQPLKDPIFPTVDTRAIGAAQLQIQEQLAKPAAEPIRIPISAQIAEPPSALQRQIEQVLDSVGEAEIDVPLVIQAPRPGTVEDAIASLQKLKVKPEPLITATEQRELHGALDVVGDYVRARNQASQISEQLSAQSVSASEHETVAIDATFRAVERKIDALRREGAVDDQLADLEAKLADARVRASQVRTDRRGQEELRFRQATLDLETKIAEQRAEQLRSTGSPSDERASIAADLLAKELSITAASERAVEAAREQFKERKDLTDELEQQLGLISAQAALERQLARESATRANRELTRSARANVDALEEIVAASQRDAIVEGLQRERAETERLLRIQDVYARSLAGSTDNLDDQLTASKLLRESERARLVEELRLLDAEEDQVGKILDAFDKQSARERAIQFGRGSLDRERGPFQRTDDEISIDVAKRLKDSRLQEGMAGYQEAFDALRRSIKLTQDVTQAFGTSARENITGLITGTESLSDAFRNVGLTIEKELIDRLISLPLSNALQGLVGNLLGGIGGNIGGGGESQGSQHSLLARGGAFDAAGRIPFARGGVFGAPEPFASGDIFDSPTRFGFGRNKTGVLGEAGPEAILPLERGSGGKLGVRASGAPQQTTVVNNYTSTTRMVVNTPNADSFRKSKRQIVADLGRAARGR